MFELELYIDFAEELKLIREIFACIVVDIILKIPII